MNDIFFIDESFSDLSKMAYVNRINSLACIMAAEHGWIGATFSCAEMLTYLYFEKMNLGDMLILSKGHAAPMQYACLAGRGVIPFKALLSYKTKEGLQAHTDKMTPGIVSNTGSLGQSLSKACGLALVGQMKNRQNKIYVVLGDGELQEGQNYEALMTLKKFNLTNVVPIIDRNNLQTDSAVKDIKDVGDIDKIFSGFGSVVKHVDGHDISKIRKLFSELDEKNNNIIIADTIKGFGSRLTAMDKYIGRRKGLWHSAVPNREEYISILDDLVAKIDVPEVSSSFQIFRKKACHKVANVSKPSAGMSTRDVFSEVIVRHAEKNDKIVVLDADLERSMKLTAFAERYPERFFEIGIAEQDMVSVAGGLALKKFIPVVNTYASFFRRAYEQIYINATEKLHIIYVGHYSGLSYFTDGKSHQMTGDVQMMRAILGMRVFDPFCNEELENILSHYLDKKRGKDIDHPVYIKLRRSPADHKLNLGRKYTFGLGKGHELVKGKGLCFVPCGTHLTALCAKVAREDTGRRVGVVAFSAQNYLDESEAVRLLSKYRTVIVVEETVTAGGLGDEITGILTRSGLGIRIIRKGVNDFTFSSRDKDALFSHFGMDLAGLKKLASTWRNV